MKQTKSLILKTSAFWRRGKEVVFSRFYPLFRLFVPKQDKRCKSHPLSHLLQKHLEKKALKRVVGAALVVMVFFTNLIAQPIDALDAMAEEPVTLPQPEETVLTETVFDKPLEGRVCQGFRRFHPAIDICAPLKTPIRPVAPGRVIEVSYGRWGYGHTVVIEHKLESGTYRSRYAHLGKIKVIIGEPVTKNTVIGGIGMTGWTTGPHLHLELRTEKGRALNPSQYLPTFNYLIAQKK